MSRRRLTAITMCLAAIATAITAETLAASNDTPDATQQATPNNTPDHTQRGATLLAQVRDHVPSFDDEAFYWLIDHLRSIDPAVASAPTHSESADWLDLTQRPTEFRGRRVTVEGIIAGSRGFTARRPDGATTGAVLQTEILDKDDSHNTTIITVVQTDPLPLGRRVRVDGIFLKVYQYQTRAGSTAYAPLIVARQVTLLNTDADLTATTNSSDASVLQRRMIAMIGGMALIWLALRWKLRRSDRSAAVTDITPPVDSDFEWLLNPDDAPADRNHDA